MAALEKSRPAHLEELRKLNWALSAYARAADALINSRNLEEIYEKVCTAIVERDDYALSTVALIDGDKDFLRIAARAGRASDYLDEISLSARANITEGKGPTGRALRSKSSVILKDASSDPDFLPWRDRAATYNIRSSVAVPIVCRDGFAAGVLLVYAGEVEVFGDEEIRLFESLASHLATAITLDRERSKYIVADEARKAAEIAALESDNRHFSTINSLKDMVMGLDHYGRVLYLNESARSFIEPRVLIKGELVGSYFWDLLPLAPGQPLARAHAKAVTLNTAQSTEYFYPDAKRWIRANFFPIDSGVTCYVQDITEQKLMERHFAHTQRIEVVGRLAGGVAHDFNNLLSVIFGNAELLGDEFSENALIQKRVTPILLSAQRGADLTQRLLAFSRLQELRSTPTDIGSVINNAELMLARLLGTQIELRIDNQAQGVMALADASQLELAIVNLCVNSRDAMPDGGAITLKISCVTLAEDSEFAEADDGAAREYVCVSVQDEGIGMAEETLAKVFDPFFTTKDVDKGTGLGLSMVYGFARQSAGNVSIVSKPGEGTTVSLLLPRAKMDDMEAISHAYVEVLPQGHECILLVEDNELLRVFAGDQLKALGYKVLSATSAPEALALLNANDDVRLLLSDIILPDGKNGLQLASEIRKVRPEINVLFASGFADEALNIAGISSDNIDLLNKPYTRSELAKRVRAALDGLGK